MVGNKPVPAKGGSLFGSTTVNWEDAYKAGNVMWRVPRNIRLNDNIVVREDEIAVFYRDGKVLAYFDRPDRYALTSLNAPVVGGLVKALSGVQQEAEVYYVQRRIFDGAFGSQAPFAFRDPDFGIVSLRTFGTYRWRVNGPDLFINQFVGTFGAASTQQVESRLREQIVLLVYTTLGQMKEKGMRVTDIAASLPTIEQAVLGMTTEHFTTLGVELVQLQGLSITFPDSVQKALETRSTMGILGVNYLQYQAGQAMTTAAGNPSGAAGALAGAGVGLGAGLGVGYGMAGQLGGIYAGQAPGGPSGPCPRCGQLVPPGQVVCPHCRMPLTAAGAQAAPAPAAPAPPAPAETTVPCPKCSSPNKPGAKFCSECAAPLSPPPPQMTPCPKCGAMGPAGRKFCSECATPVGVGRSGVPPP